MSVRHQDKRHSHDNHRSNCPDGDKIEGCPATANDGINPTLFALATTLPLNCFPNDDDHPARRHGALNNRYGVERNAHHGKVSMRCSHAGNLSLCLMSESQALRFHCAEQQELRTESTSSAARTNLPTCHDMTWPSSIQKPCPDCCKMNEGLSYRISPNSVSTVASAPSNWFPDDPAVAEFGIFGTSDGMLPSHDGGISPLQSSYPVSFTNSDFLADTVRIATQNQNEQGRRLAPCVFGPTVHPQLVPLDDSKMPCSALLSELSVDHSGGHRSGEPVTLQQRFLPSAVLPPASELLLKLPVLSCPEAQHVLGDSSFQIGKDADNFLDELGTAMEWAKAEPRPENPESDMHVLDSGYGNVLSKMLPARHEQDHYQHHQNAAVCSPDVWEQELRSWAANGYPAFPEPLHNLDHHLLE